MSSEAQQPPLPPLRKILKMVANPDDTRLLLLWLQHGPADVLRDPEVRPWADRLTTEVRDALIAGDLVKIQGALDNEPHGEDTDAAVRPYWAIVRI
jgi:hypothetical protein